MDVVVWHGMIVTMSHMLASFYKISKYAIFVFHEYLEEVIKLIKHKFGGRATFFDGIQRDVAKTSDRTGIIAIRAKKWKNCRSNNH